MMGMFYKMVFDISAFYAFVCFFFGYALGYETSALSCNLFFVAAFVLAMAEQWKQKRKTAVLLAAILPAFALILEKTMLGRLEVVLLWCYFLFTIKQESYLIYYYHFLDKLKGLLWAWIIPLVLVLLDVERGILAINLAGPYFIIFLASGVLTLQAARYRATRESRKQFERYQLVQTVLFFIVAGLLTAGKIVDIVQRCFVKPILNFLLILLQRVLQSLGKAAAELPEMPELYLQWNDFQEAKEQEEEAELFVAGNEWAEMLTEMTEQQEPMDNTPLLIALGILLAVILLAALMNSAAKRSRVTTLFVEREDLSEDEGKKKKAKKFLHPEVAVRRYYREFMRKAEAREQTILASDTTEEIKSKYNNTAAAKEKMSEELTQIYRSVRYGRTTATYKTAAKMKQMLKNL